MIRTYPGISNADLARLALTMEGHTLLVECRRRVKALERALENGLSAEQAALLRHWLVEAARTP